MIAPMLWGGFFAVGLVLGYIVRLIHNLSVEVGLLKHDHMRCITRTSRYVGDAHAASVLREAAKSWESVEERSNLKRLEKHYSPGGPSMVNIWLNDRADTLMPKDGS